MIRLAALFVLVVAVATWVLFASSILDAVGNGGRAPILETAEPLPTAERTASPTPAASPAATATATATPDDTAAPTPAPTATATPGATVGPDGEQLYTIEAGDNLTRIANRFGVTVAALQEANGIDDPSSIRVGQQIVIPAPEPD